MDKEYLIGKLSRLIQLEIDVNHTYGLVLKKIDDEVMRRRLAQFEEQHKAHIEHILKEIKDLGGPEIDFSPDIKGYLVSGVTALLSTTGDTGALQGLKLGEDMTTGHYEEAMRWEVPGRIKKMIRSHFSDEKIHLDYLENNLKALKRKSSQKE
jgi:hypothetical protein